jgi:hypothetical protein
MAVKSHGSMKEPLGAYLPMRVVPLPSKLTAATFRLTDT